MHIRKYVFVYMYARHSQQVNSHIYVHSSKFVHITHTHTHLFYVYMLQADSPSEAPTTALHIWNGSHFGEKPFQVFESYGGVAGMTFFEQGGENYLALAVSG
jgi:hypothetical protein